MMPIDKARTSNVGGGTLSSGAWSEDGKGETAPIPETRAAAQYIFYRLYTKDGPLESKYPIYSNDLVISTISSKSLRPPKTAASLKKYICKIEGLGSFDNCTLYRSLSDKTALEDSIRLSFQGTAGPGLSNLDPMALVIDMHTASELSQDGTIVDPPKLIERDYKQRYVYYIVYDEDGEAMAKTSFGHNNPFLGRVKTLSIPPPLTVSSLKHHLVKSEEILGHNIQLFEHEDSDSPMVDSDAIALLADKFPGFNKDRPIAITYESQGKNNRVIQEDPKELLKRDLLDARFALAQMKNELQEAIETRTRELQRAKFTIDQLKEELRKSNEAHARELREAQQLPALIQALSERLTFTTKLKARVNYSSDDPTWHSTKTGDIFYTDGIIRNEAWSGYNGQWPGYLAISPSGKLAFAYQYYVRPC